MKGKHLRISSENKKGPGDAFWLTKQCRDIYEKRYIFSHSFLWVPKYRVGLMIYVGLWLLVPAKWIEEPSSHSNGSLFCSFNIFTSFLHWGGSRATEGLYFQFTFATQVSPYSSQGVGHQIWKGSRHFSDKLWFVNCSLSNPSISRLVNL